MLTVEESLSLGALPESVKVPLVALRVALESTRLDPMQRRAAMDYLKEKVCPKCGRLYDEFCPCWMD